MLENLNVAGIMKNRHLAQAIADVGLYEFRWQLQYKGAWYGCQIRLGDRFYPSTRRRSGRGQLRKIELSEREVHCPACGLVLERDFHMGAGTEHQPVLDRFE